MACIFLPGVRAAFLCAFIAPWQQLQQHAATLYSGSTSSIVLHYFNTWIASPHTIQQLVIHIQAVVVVTSGYFGCHFPVCVPDINTMWYYCVVWSAIIITTLVLMAWILLTIAATLLACTVSIIAPASSMHFSILAVADELPCSYLLGAGAALCITYGRPMHCALGI